MSRTSELVLCRCSRCGPSARKVNRRTRTEHQFFDRERMLLDPELWSRMRATQEGALDSSENWESEDDGFGDIDAEIFMGEPADVTASDEPLDDETTFFVSPDEPAEDSDSSEDSVPDLVPSLSHMQAELDAPFDVSLAEGQRPRWIWLFEILLLWLNAMHGVSERICALLLAYVSAATQDARRQVDQIQELSTSMRRVRRSLGIDIGALQFALCPDRSCWSPHRVEPGMRRDCTRCDTSLFPRPTATAHVPISRPLVPLGYHSISAWLHELAPRRDFFTLCNHWRHRDTEPDTYQDLYDGSSWQREPPSTHHSLSLALMIDSIQPFSARPGTAPYSCCVLTLRIDNLPSHLRDRIEYTHVCCILPGPSKPQAQALHSILKIIVADIRQLQKDGILVKDWHGNEHRLHAQLGRLLADTEARTTAAGFPQHSSLSQFCPWCLADGKTWHERHIQAQPFGSRDAADHRRDCLAALRADRCDDSDDPSPHQIKRLRRERAAAPCVLYQLPGWSSLAMAPVDVMHAMDLGLCKHFWTQTLIHGGLLDMPDLQSCQARLSLTTYPAGVQRISTTLGDTGGGSPTANGWSILSRYLLPPLLAMTWALRASETKSFASGKRDVVAKKKKGKSKKRKRGSTRASSNETETNAGSDLASTAFAPHDGTSAGQVVKTKKKAKRLFTRPVYLTRIVEASLHLAYATRLVHARTITESQLIKLHHHISEFVSILASDIHPRWLTYNFHIALHIAEQIRLHGPARQYWSYDQERSYNLMKRITTNRHRNGDVEVTLLNRTAETHRLATILDQLPPSGPAQVLKDLIGHSHGQGASADDGGPAMDADGRAHELTEDEATSICTLVNASLPVGTAPLVSFRDSGNDEAHAENILHLDDVVRVDSLSIHPGEDGTIRRRTASAGLQYDPSACIVASEGTKRLAFFSHALRLRYQDVITRKSYSRTFAVMDVADHVPWPRHTIFRSEMWQEMHYIFARKGHTTRLMVEPSSILSNAITVESLRHLHFPADVVLAIPLNLHL